MKFQEISASTEYTNNFYGRRPLEERIMDLIDIGQESSRVVELFEAQRWTEMLSDTRSVAIKLVHEFYSNIHRHKGLFNDLAPRPIHPHIS